MSIYTFRGQVIAGQMAGHALRVDGSRPPGCPMGVYTLVYTDPLNPRRKIVGYAPGLAGLRSYFEDLRLHVDWERGRSPLDAPLPLHRRRPRTRGQLRRQRRRAEHNLQRARRAKRAVRAERSEDGAG